MNQNEIIAAEIFAKSARLIKKLQVQDQQINQLVEENFKLKKILEEQTKSLNTIKETNKITKLAVGINLSDLEKAELKQLISAKIKQIDDCLKMLNNLG
jgi:small-conductance mechanosensitive channel